MTKQTSLKSVFGAYLRRNLNFILVFGIFIALLFAVYGLYGLPWGPAVYTSVLLIFCAGIFGVVGLYRYHQKLARMKTLKLQADAMLGELPEPRDRLERDYQELILLLEQRCRDAEAAAACTIAGATRYYTLWSHQIKTPISAMRLLLREEPLEMGAFEQELFKTEQYVGMALQYQRLNGGIQDLVLQEYEEAALVKQALKRVSTLFIHKRVGITLGELNGRVITDEKWMVFVLEQLLTNAVKYTPEGGSVSVRRLPSEEATLVIEDTGIGIRPEDLPRVFEWGYTGYNGRLDKRSTGIGLSLCRQALGMLGHTLCLESEVGRGTRVLLNLARERFEIE